MFSYYGGKSKIINKYPSPKYNTIIEPFAGSARYSMKYFNKNIILNDLYKVIFDIWNFLITANADDIKNIPEMSLGDNVKSLNLPQVQKDLLGFMVNRGVPYPHFVYTKWPYESNEIKRVKERIIKYLPKIRHWKCYNKSYLELENIEATWFIDPPYQKGGERYIHNSINYKELKEWCLSRKGQIIVCENSSANWMDFKPLSQMNGQKHKTMEVIYTN